MSLLKLDLIRCRIDCKSPRDLVETVKEFFQIVEAGRGGIITKVIQVKNEFKSGKIAHNYDYGLIKMNVLIESLDPVVAMIAEIQFGLSLLSDFQHWSEMLNSLIRNEDLFQHVSYLYEYHSIRPEKLTNILATHNLKEFENLMLFYDLRHLQGIERLLYDLLFQFKWPVAAKLFYESVFKTKNEAFIKRAINKQFLVTAAKEQNKELEDWQEEFLKAIQFGVLEPNPKNLMVSESVCFFGLLPAKQSMYSFRSN